MSGRIPHCLMHVEADQILLDTFNHEFIQFFFVPLNIGKTCTSFPLDKLCHHEDLPDRSEYADVTETNNGCRLLFFRYLNQQSDWQWMACILVRFMSESKSNHLVFSTYFFKLSSILKPKQLKLLCNICSNPYEIHPLPLLSDREKEVLRLIVAGKSYKQIAILLHIQPDTVNRHRKNMMKKLKIRNIQLLTCFAIRHGLI